MLLWRNKRKYKKRGKTSSMVSDEFPFPYTNNHKKNNNNRKKKYEHNSITSNCGKGVGGGGDGSQVSYLPGIFLMIKSIEIPSWNNTSLHVCWPFVTMLRFNFIAFQI